MSKKWPLWLLVPSLLFAEITSSGSGSWIPLTDMGAQTYLGFSGGLYPGASNVLPADHMAAGLAHAARVQPLDALGRPSPSGKIVMISIGMSNTTQEFCAAGNPAPCNSWSFVGQATADSAVNHMTLMLINGARGGQDAKTWISPTMVNYDLVKNNDLIPAGLTEAQVQVAWVKEADAGPTSSLPASTADAYALEAYLGQIVRALKARYPNLQLVYLSSRIYAGYATSTLNPEPYAYESGFAVKWLIEAQINQMRGMITDTRAGDLNYNTVAPWIAWGPYLWANGATPRSDGLMWIQSDFESDGTHPATPGEQKVGGMLLSFFKTDATARSWFLAEAPPIITAAFSYSPANPTVGQIVAFTDLSTGGPMSWSWIFGDGQGSSERNPTHVFTAAGTYAVTLTASNTNSQGSVTRNITVTAAPSAPVADFILLPATPRPAQLVQFVDVSTGSPISWSWNFGDPSSGVANVSTLQNPTHAFLAAGTYRVSLMATNAFGSSQKIQDVIVCTRCPQVIPFR